MDDYRSKLYERYSDFRRTARAAGRTDREGYFRWLDHKVAPFLRGLPADARILELGCGAGDFLAYLKRSGFTNAEGVDRCEAEVDTVRSEGLNASAGDALECLSKADAGYDAVIAIDFVEHFTVDELLGLLDAVHRVLKPVGRLVIQAPNAEGLFSGHVVHGDLTHMTAFTPGSLSQLLTATGFGDIRFAECGPAPKDFQGAVRLVLWKLVRAFVNLVRLIEIGTTQRIWTENMICVAERIGDRKDG